MADFVDIPDINVYVVNTWSVGYATKDILICKEIT